MTHRAQYSSQPATTMYCYFIGSTLVSSPTLSLKIFCPSLHAKLNDGRSAFNLIFQKRLHNERHYDKKQENDSNKKTNTETKGSIINKIGKKIYLPEGMEEKYCSDFLDAREYCRLGDKCNLVHAVFPGGFTDNDKSFMSKFIENEPGLSLDQNARVADKHVSATTPK